MKHIVNFSGGVDSTAMLLRMLELGLKIDEVRNFDEGSWAWPEVQETVQKVQKLIDMPVTLLTPDVSFDYLFSEKVITRGDRAGQKGYGWPTWSTRWCSGIKIKYLNKNIDSLTTVLYLGFTKGEEYRLAHFPRHSHILRFPLIDWGWDSKKCLEYCTSKGITWNGLYTHFQNVSCWCCPFRRISELRILRKKYPHFWEKMLIMGENSSKGFRKEGKTIFHYEKRFSYEDRKILSQKKPKPHP